MNTTTANTKRPPLPGWAADYSAPYRRAARQVAGLSYRELIDIVREHDGAWPPIADMASQTACAMIGASLGFTRMEIGTNQRCLNALRGVRGDSVGQPGRKLFDHARTFYSRRRVVGILTRPYTDYPGATPQQEAMDLARDAGLAVWALPTELCSWYPTHTKTYLIVRRDQPCPGPDFVRVEGSVS